MRFSWLFGLPLAMTALFFQPACRSSSDSGYETEPAPAPPDPNAELEFTLKGTLGLAPGEVREITVTSSPPGRYEISFALLGDARDASLDKAKVVADADGTAMVTLKAANSSTTFRVRASIAGERSIDIAVAVSDKGFGAVRVVPLYAGTREVKEWRASVIAGTNCKAIALLPPDKQEGALKASAPAGEAPIIESAPVGPNLAVVLRAGNYLWGCQDEPGLQAGEQLDVEVIVFDREIDLLATNLDLTLSFFAAEPESYGKLLSHAITLLAEGFLPPSGEGSAGALLDAMEAAAPAGVAESFNQHRLNLGWDDLLQQHFDSLPTSPQDQVRQWAETALQPKGDLPQPTTPIFADLRAAGDAPGKALLMVHKLGDIDAEEAGIPSTHLMKWTADASDSLMLGGSIFWLPSRYIGAAALLSAKEEVPSVTSMPGALSGVVRCAEISAALGGFPGCDVACMASLCEAALVTRWDHGLNASAASDVAGEITISASGPAKVDEDAVPMFFEGKWLGALSIGNLTTKLEGTVVGVALPKEGPPP